MEIRGKIILVRVDNRLVHGQVGGPWSASIGANVLIVVDDLVLLNPLQQRLMEFVAQSGNMPIRFFSVDGFVKSIQESQDHVRMFVVISDVLTAAQLVRKGVPIKEVNLGNMHYKKGKVALSKKVYVNQEDIEALQYLMDCNVTCFIQDVPGSHREDVRTVEDLKAKV